MFVLIMKAALLVAVTFGIFAWLGWKIAGFGRLKTNNKDAFANIPKLYDDEDKKISKVNQENASSAIMLGGQDIDSGQNKLFEISTLVGMTSSQIEAEILNAGEPKIPELLVNPKGQKDDLKIISGIGPINEKELNNLGVFHFWQIAQWTPNNIVWISEHIRFPKRIVQENWMAQAVKFMQKD